MVVRQVMEVTDPIELDFAKNALFQRHPAMQSTYALRDEPCNYAWGSVMHTPELTGGM